MEINNNGNGQKMINFDKAEKVLNGSYIFRNFLSEELCDKLRIDSENSEEGSLHLRKEDNIYLIGTPVLQECIDEVNKLLEGSGYWADLFLHWMVPYGYHFYVHRDDANPDYSGYEKEWGGVIYLTDFEGGDLYYPEEGVEVHPNKRDMVIHRSDLPHGTRTTLTDERRTITFVVYSKKQG